MTEAIRTPSENIKDQNRHDKPRERLRSLGATSLSDKELLAIILRSGGKSNSVINISGRILDEFGGLKGLMEADLHQISAVKYIGPAKASSIKAVFEIALRIIATEQKESFSITRPSELYEIVKKDLYGKTKEHLYVISLDSRNKCISKDLISIGTVNETLIHPREIFRTALHKNATYIALAHNHPSGDTTPSDEDIKVTQRVASAGSILGVSLIDHLVVSDRTFTSIKSMNALKNLSN